MFTLIAPCSHTHARTQVYTLTLQEVGVPSNVIAGMGSTLENMLGLIRGNVYYNMINWYRCLTCIPVGDTSKYMETMMGVKQVIATSIPVGDTSKYMETMMGVKQVIATCIPVGDTSKYMETIMGVKQVIASLGMI